MQFFDDRHVCKVLLCCQDLVLGAVVTEMDLNLSLTGVLS